MYVPKHFAVQDVATLTAFLKEHSFGILFSQTEQGQIASHLPLGLGGDLGEAGSAYLYGHMAKANPQWRGLAGREALAVFSGPHAYISPAWYETPQTVPTWNYAAVHVYGKIELVEDRDGLKQMMRDSLHMYEPNSPLLEQMDEPFFENLLQAVVGFRIPIERIEGKWKLSQNHPLERQQKVVAALRKKGNDSDALQIASLMERNWQTDDSID